METYIVQGESLMDCKLKIAAKYNRPFNILRCKDIKSGGFLGLFSKPGVQAEFYFTPQRQNNSAAEYNPRPAASRNVLGVTTEEFFADKNLEQEKQKVIAAARKNISETSESGKEASQQILDALKELKEKVEGTGKKEDHPSFVRAEELLKSNDFSEKYINGMIERLRKELPLEKLDKFEVVQDYLLEWIGESISIYKEEPVTHKPRIMVLVGPTGVGKTTTISKLAAIYGIGTEEIPAVDVRLITIDTFRICAKEQLEQIGDIMRIPVSCALDRQEVRKEIALCGNDIDLILIDTIGNSPKDSSKIGEMKDILDGCPKNAEYHLVISAATKTSDIEVILRQFEPFDYKSIILSKMDETDSYGNIISALAEKKKSISFITNGQGVPEDIRRASVVHFLINLDGFKVDREKIEKRFPSGEAGQFKWR